MPQESIITFEMPLKDLSEFVLKQCIYARFGLKVTVSLVMQKVESGCCKNVGTCTLKLKPFKILISIIHSFIKCVYVQ